MKQRTAEKAFMYVENTISFLASFPVLDKLEWVVPIVDVIYQNLVFAGVLKDKLDVKVQEEMKAALQRTVQTMSSGVNAEHEEFLKDVQLTIGDTLDKSQGQGAWNTDEMERVINDTLSKCSKQRGLYDTPKEIREIARAFMACFEVEVQEPQELRQAVLWDEVENLKGKLCEVSKRVDKIENKQKKMESKLFQSEEIPHLLTVSPPKVDMEKFLHRGKETAEIQAMLSQGKRVVLVNGLGGIGKTAVARYVYHEMEEAYEYAAWVPYSGSLKESLLSSMYLYQTEEDKEFRYRRIESFLQNHKNLLLVIDNANQDVAQDESMTLLHAMNATVLVTSRLSEIAHFHTYSIDFMDEEECVDIFYRYYKYDKEKRQQETARELVKMVWCHTLSVELLAKAANVIEYRDLKQYQTLLKEKGFEGAELRVSTDHTVKERTISEHLVKLFELVSVTEEQQRILKNFSIMPSMAVPWEVKTWLEFDTNDLHALVTLGWIQETEGGYLMPDVVKTAVLLQGSTVKPEDCVGLIEAVVQQTYFTNNDTYLSARPKLEIADAYVERFWETETEVMASFIHNIGYTYHIYGEYGKALQYYKKASEVFIKIVGVYNQSIASIYNNIGQIYHIQGNYKKALEYHEKALKIREEIFGENHSKTAISYNNIGQIYHSQGNYEKALEYCKKALKIQGEVLGENHRDTAASYNNIGLIYRAYGKYNESLEYYEKALKIQEEVLGKNHSETAMSYNNIGSIYHAQGNYEGALEYHEKALKIREKILGENHLETAMSYNNIGGIYQTQGKYNEALEYYEKVLKIYEEVLGKNHPDTATSYNNIGTIYRDKGNYEEALKYYEKALGETHPNTAMIYSNIGNIYYTQGKYKKALEYYKRSLKIQEKILGKNHPNTATSYGNIGNIYYVQGKYEKALEYIWKAFQIYFIKLGKEHPDTETASTNMKIIYGALENQKPFEEWLAERMKEMQ